MLYDSTYSCTYDILIQIIRKTKNVELDIPQLKLLLLKEYNKLFKRHNPEVVYKLLFHQGKVNEIRRVGANQLQFADYLLSDNYFITNLDIWLIAQHFKIGVVLLSSTKLVENRKSILPLYYPSKDANNYIFIKSSGVKANIIPKFRLIIDDKGEFLFDFQALNKNMQALILSTKTLTGKGLTIDSCIENFEPVVYKPKKKLRVKMQIVEEHTDEGKQAVKPVVASPTMEEVKASSKTLIKPGDASKKTVKKLQKFKIIK